MVDQLLRQEQEQLSPAEKDQDGDLATIDKESEEGSVSPSKVGNSNVSHSHSKRYQVVSQQAVLMSKQVSLCQAQPVPRPSRASLKP